MTNNKRVKGFGYTLHNGKVEECSSINPKEDVAIFSSRDANQYEGYNLPFGWQVEVSFGQTFLTDKQGIRRPIQPKVGLETATRYNSWSSFDTWHREQQIEKLKQDVEWYKRRINQIEEERLKVTGKALKLEDTLLKVYQTNEQGGHGSRKKVSKLILEVCPWAADEGIVGVKLEPRPDPDIKRGN